MGNYEEVVGKVGDKNAGDIMLGKWVTKMLELSCGGEEGTYLGRGNFKKAD